MSSTQVESLNDYVPRDQIREIWDMFVLKLREILKPLNLIVMPGRDLYLHIQKLPISFRVKLEDSNPLKFHISILKYVDRFGSKRFIDFTRSMSGPIYDKKFNLYSVLQKVKQICKMLLSIEKIWDNNSKKKMRDRLRWANPANARRKLNYK